MYRISRWFYGLYKCASHFRLSYEYNSDIYCGYLLMLKQEDITVRIGNLWIENDGDRTKLCAEVQVTSNAIERWKKNTLAIDKDIATKI